LSFQGWPQNALDPQDGLVNLGGAKKQVGD
jgi:hypothetical protein